MQRLIAGIRAIAAIQAVRFLFMLAIGCIAVPAPRAAQASTPEVLTPSAPWTVNYADKKCSAVRVFGTEKSAVTLLLDQYGPGDAFKLSLIGKRFGNWTETKGSVQLRFGPAENWQKLDYFIGHLGKDRPAVFSKDFIGIVAPSPETIAAWGKEEKFQPPSIDDAQRAAVRSLEVSYRGRAVHLLTGRLDRLSGTLNKCTDDLVKTWGFDPVAMRSWRSPPMPLSSPSTWITANDYPMSSIKRGERAMVMVRLNIDAAGAITACDIQQASRDGDFAAIVCRALTERGKFAPAMSSSGEPIAAFWRNAVTFVLPR